jgi:predicted deacetylase
MTARIYKVLKAMLIPPRFRPSPDVAKFILSWKFTPAHHRRVHILSGKANEGELTQGEREELQWYCDLSTLVDIAQAKARQALRRVDGSGKAIGVCSRQTRGPTGRR